MTVPLRNRYFALRHGTSLANEKRIIVSHPENGVTNWGLSPRGMEECRRVLAPARLTAFGFGRHTTVVYTSDFRRAYQTAEIFCEQNDLDLPITDARLRERHFGRLEGRSVDAYALVWARDAGDDNHRFEGCESIVQLASRLQALLADLEASWQARSIVLVSHGDPLQVLQAILLGVPCNRHRTLPHLETAELRPLDQPAL